MSRFLIIICLIFLGLQLANATENRPVPLDSGEILLVERNIPSSHINDYTRLPEYSYRKSILYETNIFKRYWNSFKRWLSNMFNLADDSGLGTILFYLVIGAAIVGLIFHLMRSTYNNPLQKSIIDTLDDAQIILNQEGSGNRLLRKINEFESSGDMRQALRFRFIHTVWQLNSKGVIQWQPEMTNYQILKLISSKSLKTSFKKLVSIYEHIWYGHYPIESQHQYISYRSEFNSFNEKINQLS